MARHRLQYPASDADPTVERVHGETVADPYRWLEEPDSQRARAWVAAQSAVTDAHLATLPSRPWFTKKLQAIVSAPRTSLLRRQGGRYLLCRNDGSQAQDSVHVADSLQELQAGGRLLLDLEEFSADGRVALGSVFSGPAISISPDGKWLAYGLSEAGSDWIHWRVRHIRDGTDTGDRVTRSKFVLAQWLGDSSGFLYCAYPEDAARETLGGATLGATVQLHRLGTCQDDDVVVHEAPRSPREQALPGITPDGRWLILDRRDGMAGQNRLTAMRISAGGDLGEPIDVVTEARALYALAGNDGDVLYLRTDDGSPNGRLLAIDLAAIEAGSDPDTLWREVIREQPAVLTAATRAGHGFLGIYLDEASHHARRFTLDGKDLGHIGLDGPCAVVDLDGRAGQREALIASTTFVSGTRLHRVDMDTGHAAALELSGGNYATDSTILTERYRATSADGTVVPYFQLRRADLDLDVPRATILYGYGGFNVPAIPNFSAAWPAWLEAGGVLVIANVRGGGEYGRDWYEAGTRQNKQNVFDDFIAVAEDVVAKGVTTPAQSALHGRSNGGLLVGAVMTQRPDLAAVALPAVAVLDMLRFHKFSIGWAWTPDFGDPDAAEDFAFLRAYSPLHSVRDGVRYPATLVLTGEHDDRVVPAHSYKFTARLQQAQNGDAPVLVRIERATGHGGGKAAAVLAAEVADMLAFAAEHTGLQPD